MENDQLIMENPSLTDTLNFVEYSPPLQTARIDNVGRIKPEYGTFRVDLRLQ